MCNCVYVREGVCECECESETSRRAEEGSGHIPCHAGQDQLA